MPTDSNSHVSKKADPGVPFAPCPVSKRYRTGRRTANEICRSGGTGRTCELGDAAGAQVAGVHDELGGDAGGRGGVQRFLLEMLSIDLLRLSSAIADDSRSGL